MHLQRVSGRHIALLCGVPTHPGGYTSPAPPGPGSLPGASFNSFNTGRRPGEPLLTGFNTGRKAREETFSFNGVSQVLQFIPVLTTFMTVLMI